ncbi:MAG: imidazole glycerol phosphate synthase subunit HisH [Bacillota bacterium]
MIAIIDYGVGNLKSVYKALEKLGYPGKITSDKEEILKSKGIILPGVGAFKDAIDNLSNRGLVSCIQESARNGKPILGICLGMQLLFEKSFEDGEWKGLGILEGDIVRFQDGLKVPHMGWNNVYSGTKDTIGNGVEDGEYAYFVHSYYLEPQNNEDVVFWTDYGVKVPAVVRKDNVVGMQFHPEKSGHTGLKLLKNFGELIR